MITIEIITDKWPNCASELASEIIYGKLNFGEVRTDLFVAWYLWRMKHEPMVGEIPLSDFDIHSAMMFFEDDVKNQLNPLTK